MAQSAPPPYTIQGYYTPILLGLNQQIVGFLSNFKAFHGPHEEETFILMKRNIKYSTEAPYWFI